MGQPVQPEDARDAELVAAANRGDAAAWSTLLQRHQDRLFAVCLRMVGPREAADRCQDAMVKIVQGLHSFDGSAQVSTWMTRVAMNVCLSHLRGAKLRKHASLDAMLESGAGRGLEHWSASDRGAAVAGRSGEPGPDSGVQSEEMRRSVAAALLRLEPEQRAILVLRDVRGLDYDQIAAVLEVAVGTVKSRLFRARAALRAILEEAGAAAAKNDAAK